MSKHPGRWGLFAAVALALYATRRLFPARVEGPSMAPTLQPGDLVACSRGRPRTGDVVVVRGRPDVIKRVSAIDGGRVFVVGDNLAASTDSRALGPVGIEDVAGVARAIYWPPGRWRLL